jgi:hypothetical protein
MTQSILYITFVGASSTSTDHRLRLQKLARKKLAGIHMVRFEVHDLEFLTGVCLQLFSKHYFRGFDPHCFILLPKLVFACVSLSCRFSDEARGGV